MAGESTSSGSSFSNSQSTSTPQIMDSAQSDWGLTESQLLHMLGDQQMQWAQGKIAKGEQITDQMVGQFIELSGRGKGLADTLIHQYQDQFKPLMDQYIREAGSYASEGRQAFEAGKAMSTVGQADEAALKAAEQKLQAYGANPNSGRYQELELSAATRDAAARAGAGTQASENTAAVGRQMTEKALAMGQNLPGQAMNAVNSAYAGLTGAENSLLSFINTAGSLISQAVKPFYDAAIGANKLPPVGNQSQSTAQGGSQQQSQSRQTDAPKQDREKGEGGEKGPGKEKGPGQGGGGAGGREAGESPQKFGPPQQINPQTLSNIPQTSKDDNDEATGAGSMDGYTGAVPYFDENGVVSPQYDPNTFEEGKYFGPDTSQWAGEQAPFWSPPDSGQGFNVDPGAAGADNPQLGGIYNPQAGFNDDAGANRFQNYDTPNTDNTFDPLENWNQNAASYNNQQDQSQGGNDYNDYGSDDLTSSDYDYDQGYSDDGDYNSYDDSNSYDNSYDDGGYDAGGYDDNDSSSYDDSGYDSGYDAGGYDDNDSSYYDDGYDSGGYDSGGYDSGGYDSGSDGGYEYARGGRVRPSPQQRGVVPMGRQRQSRRPPTTGGPVPRSASPSQGRQTDDISARLNAGEYVIPRDVVSHKGTEFFTKMIQNSRKLRTGMAGATPKPTMRPALQQRRPSFTSRPLPPR